MTIPTQGLISTGNMSNFEDLFSQFGFNLDRQCKIGMSQIVHTIELEDVFKGKVYTQI